MMHGQWDPKTFFRHFSEAALAAWFCEPTAPPELDGRGSGHEQLYRAWKELPDTERLRLEAALSSLADLCTAEGRPYLEELAELTWRDAKPLLADRSRDWSTQDLALRLFVRCPERLLATSETFALDHLDHFCEYRGRRALSAERFAEARGPLRQAIAARFAGREGPRAVVEEFADEERFVLIVYREGEPQPVDRFDDEGRLESQWQRRAVRLTAVFHRPTRTLLVGASRQTDRRKLRDLFASVVAGDPDYFEDPDLVPKYCFDPLRNPEFDFPTRGEDQVETVWVVRVIAKPALYPPRRVVVDVPAGIRAEGLRAVLAEHGVILATDSIDGVHLRVQFEGRGRSKYRTVSLMNPNQSNLRDTPRVRLIMCYLKQWGIDARPSRLGLGLAACAA